MSEPALPEDLSLWPQSPYELLGVTPGTSERDVRRAYTRLIRTWKPEQFPDHFRRIRDAYELLLRFASYFVPGAQPEPQSTETPLQDHTPAPVDDLDAIWRLALKGDLATAYRRLVELDERRPGRADVALRLYWLLKLQRDLDPNRVPSDWLVHGLMSNGVTGPLRELYLRELRDDPAEVKSARCERLMAVPMAGGRLADLVEARWAALTRLGAWDQLMNDIKSLGPRIVTDSEQAWLRLVGALADRVAWLTATGGVDVFDECQDEFDRHEHLAIHFPAEFDRLDGVAHAAKAWRALDHDGRLPYALLRVIALSWTEPFNQVRPLLDQVLNELQATPADWLEHLTILQNVASVALEQFGRLLDEYQESREWVSPRLQQLEGLELAQEFFAHARESYPACRKDLLEFCIRQAIPPEHVAELIEKNITAWPVWVMPLAQQITDDWPIRYVYRGWALFWA